MPPKHQENKWKGEQVRDRKDYKKTGNIHNKKVEDYDNWYMGEHQKISATEKNSTALGVNRLSREVNQVGFAKCADVVEPAKMFVFVRPDPWLLLMPEQGSSATW